MRGTPQKATTREANHTQPGFSVTRGRCYLAALLHRRVVIALLTLLITGVLIQSRIMARAKYSKAAQEWRQYRSNQLAAQRVAQKFQEIFLREAWDCRETRLVEAFTAKGLSITIDDATRNEMRCRTITAVDPASELTIVLRRQYLPAAALGNDLPIDGLQTEFTRPTPPALVTVLNSYQINITRWRSILLPVCLAVLIVAIASRSIRQVMAEVLLGMAFIYVVVGLLGLRPAPFFGVDPHDASLWIGVGLLAATVGWLFLLGQKPVNRTSDPLCGKCGYNLTGNLSGVCPECGTTTTAAIHDRVTKQLDQMFDEPD